MKKTFIAYGLFTVSLITACSSVENESEANHSINKNEASVVSDHSNNGMLEEVVVTAQVDHARSQRVTKHRTARAERAEKAEAADMASGAIVLASPRLIQPIMPPVEVDRENYLDFDENPVKLVQESPVSTFSIDVDTASYANMRRMLVKEGRLPPAEAIKIEEMVNYFDYRYPAPESPDQPFTVRYEIASAPWHPEKRLLQIGLKGYAPEQEQRPAANLVFLVDVSGSMHSPDKLGLVKRSLSLLVNQMTEDDYISLVVYAGAAGQVLPPTQGTEKRKIMNAINSLEAGGSTHGSAGIQLAYDAAEEHFIEGGINRVIIASDGDMNVGITDLEALKSLIETKRQQGVALTTLGFGTGNYNYALMEQLADVGNGNAAYIDSMREAQKVLVDEMNATLLTIAKDVKIQVEFNPAVVKEYRLLGYENRLLNREDFKNDKVDAGEIGAGHTVTALYELVMTDSDAGLIEPSRYTTNEPANNSDEIGFVRLRYKAPDGDTSQELSFALDRNEANHQLSEASEDLRFASAVAGFGQLLRGGKYTNDWDYDQLISLARSSKGNDEFGYRAEMIGLIELAKNLSATP